jgi:hypothetical protein
MCTPRYDWRVFSDVKALPVGDVGLSERCSRFRGLRPIVAFDYDNVGLGYAVT